MRIDTNTRNHLITAGVVAVPAAWLGLVFLGWLGGIALPGLLFGATAYELVSGRTPVSAGRGWTPPPAVPPFPFHQNAAGRWVDADNRYVSHKRVDEAKAAQRAAVIRSLQG